MNNFVFINSLRNQLFLVFSMLDKVIDICPDELWNKKVSGFVFWQQLVHTLSGANGWLREDKPETLPMFSTFNGKNIYPEFENEPEIMLTKTDIRKMFAETKKTAELYFTGKDDNWLQIPLFNKYTIFDNITGQLKHIMYHIGHCEAIFREAGIKPGEYVDYFGE
ncbi:MAG: DinB family protein [Spirochaetaceae bacterium]|jgi:hypothetical protein|nr:DinB family protein [Spirochaetaceae bacterium]